MVRELTAAKIEVSNAPVAVHYKAHSIKSSPNTLIDKTLVALVGPKVSGRVAQKLDLLMKLAPDLNRIDAKVAKITRPLENYHNGITFLDLGEKSFQVEDSEQKIIFNSEITMSLVKRVKKDYQYFAILIFLFHEITHISQGVRHYSDVQRMKLVDIHNGRNRMGELDLSADFLAIRCLSLLLMLHDQKSYNSGEYIRWLYFLWREVAMKLLGAFPVQNRMDKKQRIFGALLMANLVSDAYVRNYPLELDAELWPEWSNNLDYLAIYRNKEPLIPGCPVDPDLMSRILASIAHGDFMAAASDINLIWKELPRY